MANQIIDWTFAAAGVANPDSTMSATTTGLADVAGPAAATVLGMPAGAVAFAPGSRCFATLSPGSVTGNRFALRILFRATANVTGRENLVESTALPFSIFLEPGNAPNRFNLSTAVANARTGWVGPTTANRKVLETGQWYVASLVYDLDTLALMIDDEVVALAAWPNGGLQAGSGDKIYVGTWTDGVRWPFSGEVSQLQMFDDLPVELEAKLDAERGNPEWHLTWKENEVRPRLNLGPKTSDYYYDSALDAWIQPYALAVISYTEAHGAAFEMHGAILALWRSDSNLRTRLGALASDEIAGRRPGSRKNAFQRGGIYWSPGTGAVAVLDRMYLDYELIGEGASAIGLPVAAEESIGGGKTQRFQSGRMYHRSGSPNAFEVHGAILAKYEAAGGPGSWGFPTTHEMDVLRDRTGIGKLSEFERCTIYWSPATPACIVYGAIRDRYRGARGVASEGGPTGHLGFPTSDESDIPGAAGARYNTFQNGSILWFGGPVFVCTPFNIALGKLDTKEEDRDFLDFDGQNDLFLRVCIDVNGGRVFDQRYPSGSNHYPSANVRDLNLTVPYRFVPNRPDLNALVRVEVWESDSGNVFGGSNDQLGIMTRNLSMANAWGLRDAADGLFTATGFGPWVNSLKWSVKPEVNALTPWDFFGVQNRGTPTVDWREYAAAFSDVDPDFEIDFGIIDDGLKAAFYELVVKGVASGGNCYGMSLEGIYAYKGLSRLGRPLARYNNWNSVEDDFNVKHIYQVGADSIWWFVGQFLQGNMHDPVSVFRNSWDAFNRGENPVICIAQNFDFSGAPHCIMPIAWDASVTPWRMTVFDSNFPNAERVVLIDPAANRYTYDGGRIYTGTAWSGGRIHYTPWCVLNHRQRTPVWDAILLLLGGVVLLFGSDAEVESLVDERGTDIRSGSVRNAGNLSGKMLEIQGISGDGPVLGNLFLGKQQLSPIRFRPDIVDVVRDFDRLLAPSIAATNAAGGAGASNGAIGGLAGHRLGAREVVRRGMRGALTRPPALPTAVVSDWPATALSGPALLAAARKAGLGVLTPPQPTDLETIRATLKGKGATRPRGRGRLDPAVAAILANRGRHNIDAYLKRGMLGYRVEGSVAAGSVAEVAFERIAARDMEITAKSPADNRFDVTVAHKMGAGGDELIVKLAGLPAKGQAPVRVNPQPGAAMIDILATGPAVDTKVEITGKVGGRKIAATFDARIDGGTRFVLPDRSDPALIKQGQIDTMLGAGRAFKTLRRN